MILDNLVQNVRSDRVMKFKFIIVFALILAFSTSCSDGTDKLSVIDEDKFVNVLTDIHMADATLAIKGFRINSDSTRVRLFYNDVLMEYNVTQKQIHNTFSYYTKNPKEFEDVYEKVSANIVKLEKEYLESVDERRSKSASEEDGIKKKDAFQKRSL